MNTQIEKLQWKDITYPGVKPGLYEISEYGDIRNKINGHMMKCRVKNRYIVTQLMTSDRFKHDTKRVKSLQFRVHRLVAYAFVDGYSEELVVNHIDGNRSNNHYTNLEWVTQLYNVRHANVTGLTKHTSGSNVNTAVLDEELVKIICEKLLEHDGSTKFVLDELRQKYTILNYGLIQNIKNKITWVSVSDKYFNKDTFKRRYYTDEEVELICQIIIQRDGNINKIMLDLFWCIDDISTDKIYNIISKHSYKHISDKYFTKDQFAIRLTDDDVELISKTLVKFNGDISKTYLELCDHPRITMKRIKNIKCKQSGVCISDKYFHGNPFRPL